jgi:hypothetical protein
MVSYRGVICIFSFEVRFVAVEPPSLIRTRSIRVLIVFYRLTLTLPFFKKGGGVGNVVLPSLGRVPTVSGELLTGEFECEPVLHSTGVG